jgi:hypothetical protein
VLAALRNQFGGHAVKSAPVATGTSAGKPAKAATAKAGKRKGG